MISFLPDSSNDAVIAEFGKGAVLYTALDGDKKAECVFIVNGSKLIFLSLKADRLPDFAEGLIRSALAYGATRGAYTAEVSPVVSAEMFVRLGFAEKNGALYAEIPDILFGCKG